MVILPIHPHLPILLSKNLVGKIPVFYFFYISLSMLQTDQNYQNLYLKQDVRNKVLNSNLSYREKFKTSSQDVKELFLPLWPEAERVLMESDYNK